MKKLILLSAILSITILMVAPTALTMGKPPDFQPNYEATVTGAVQAYDFPIEVNRFFTSMHSYIVYPTVPATVTYTDLNDIPIRLDDVIAYISVSRLDRRSDFATFACAFELDGTWFNIMADGLLDSKNLVFSASEGDIRIGGSNGTLIGHIGLIHWEAVPIQ